MTMGVDSGLSTFHRAQYLQKMSSKPLDLLVIGGGITGAGIALDAASRGLSVGLVEKQDFAGGTSSRSTKLIHGGLRYLKQGEIRLVREVGRERAILHRNAPHIVRPEKMLLPIVEKGTYGRVATSVGLRVYDWLANVDPSERRVMLSKHATLQQEPLLRDDVVKGSGLYIEYRTDDARLTIETLKTAVHFGALCCNYAEATDFLYSDGTVVGARVTAESAGSYEVRAKKVVNAAGPWADQVRNKDHSLRGKRLHLTKGVHLVVSYDRFPLRQSVYFDVSDGRMVFAIPRDGCTYIGTTDTEYIGALDRPVVTMADVKYILAAANEMFPSIGLTVQDVLSSWAGLRPLIHEDGKSPSELSRKDEVFLSQSGLITIAGGKLTGFRKMAQRVVDTVVQQLEREDAERYPACRTDQIVLSGGDFSDSGDLTAYEQKMIGLAQSLSIPASAVSKLVHRYGSNTQKILDAYQTITQPNAESDAELTLLAAELRYTVQSEMVTNLSDFFIRRTSGLFFDKSLVDRRYPDIHAAMSDWLEWNDNEKRVNQVRFEEELAAAITFV